MSVVHSTFPDYYRVYEERGAWERRLTQYDGLAGQGRKLCHSNVSSSQRFQCFAFERRISTTYSPFRCNIY